MATHHRLLALASALPVIATLLLVGLTPHAGAQEAAESEMAPPMMSREIQRDPVMFREQVLPLLLKSCAGCHDDADPMNETRHRLSVPPEGVPITDAQVERNYKNVAGLLHPTAPARSRLLQKIVPMLWGGLDHDGGKADGESLPRALIRAKEPLVAWVFGGREGQLPPIGVRGPVKRNVNVGEKVPLNGTMSNDPEGEPVAISWEIVEAPLGSKSRIVEAGAPSTVFTPDRPGPYVIRMTPSDGKLEGWPLLVRFGATAVARKATGDAPTRPAAVIDTYDRRITRSLYLDLFGRTPVEEELNAMAALPFAERVDRMLGDPTTWEHWLDEENFYFLLIDRFRPVSDRVVALPEQMLNGAISYMDAHRTIALSTEFNARNPGNDTYVTVVLEQFLGVEVQTNTKLLEAAKKMYDGKLAKIFKTKGTSQSDVITISLSQPAYTDLFVRRMSERYLPAPLTEEEHEKAVAFLLEKPTEFRKVLREWLFSQHYTSPSRLPRKKDDRQFIRALYVDLLGRPPGREEFRNMRNALQSLADPEPLRGVLSKVILDSGAVIPPAIYEQGEGAAEKGSTTDGARESRKAITELFHRLLGRDPGQDELEIFSAAIREPGASWRTAAYALLVSAHYQFY